MLALMHLSQKLKCLFYETWEDKSTMMIPTLTVFWDYFFTLASVIVNPQLAIPWCLWLGLLASQWRVFLTCWLFSAGALV